MRLISDGDWSQSSGIVMTISRQLLGAVRLSRRIVLASTVMVSAEEFNSTVGQAVILLPAVECWTLGEDKVASD